MMLRRPLESALSPSTAAGNDAAHDAVRTTTPAGDRPDTPDTSEMSQTPEVTETPESLPGSKIRAFAVGQFGWALLSGIISNWLVYFYQPDAETSAKGKPCSCRKALPCLAS